MADYLEDVYEKYALPTAERLRLENHDLALMPKRSILELRGLGKEKGVDAQEYVDRLRGEWDTQPCSHWMMSEATTE